MHVLYVLLSFHYMWESERERDRDRSALLVHVGKFHGAISFRRSGHSLRRACNKPTIMVRSTRTNYISEKLHYFLLFYDNIKKKNLFRRFSITGWKFVW